MGWQSRAQQQSAKCTLARTVRADSSSRQREALAVLLPAASVIETPLVLRGLLRLTFWQLLTRVVTRRGFASKVQEHSNARFEAVVFKRLRRSPCFGRCTAMATSPTRTSRPTATHSPLYGPQYLEVRCRIKPEAVQIYTVVLLL